MKFTPKVLKIDPAEESGKIADFVTDQVSKKKADAVADKAFNTQIFSFLILPFLKKIILSSGLLFFLSSLRDVSVPIFLTEGRPHLAFAFTSKGISGSTTTMGLFLKQSINLNIVNEAGFAQSLIITVIIVILFLSLFFSRKKERISWALLSVVNLLFSGFFLFLFSVAGFLLLSG